MRFEPVRALLLPSIIALAMCVLPQAASAQEWDLERIGEVKQAAEAAYDAEDYVDASRHYIELRGLLKTALEGGSVPDNMVESAEAALVASTYQLGRTNQLSQNCEGAATVYGELLKEPAADATIRGRGWARLAEAQSCIATQAAGRGDHKRARAALVAAGSALASLDAAVVGPLEDDADLLALESEVRTTVDTARGNAVGALVAEIDRARGQLRCDEMDRLYDTGRAEYPESNAWSDQASARDACREAVADTAPAVDEPETIGVPWWPGLIAVAGGGAVLIGAASFDSAVADDIDTLEVTLDQCNDGDIEACRDARSQRSDIENDQELVIALYVTGGIITLAGATYTIVAAAVGDDEDEPSVAPRVDVGLAPRGVAGTLTWTF